MMQVRQVDDVEVDEADAADAGERQVERHRRAKAARAHHQHAGVAQPALPDRADLAHDHVPRVAHHLVRGERAPARLRAVLARSVRHRAPPARAGITATVSPSESEVSAPASSCISRLFT